MPPLPAQPTGCALQRHRPASGGDADMMCLAAHGVSPLSGMLPMYVLMSAFHSALWLKLISCRRSTAHGLSQTGLRHSR
jgi:hypothetical protein